MNTCLRRFPSYTPVYDEKPFLLSKSEADFFLLSGRLHFEPFSYILSFRRAIGMKMRGFRRQGVNKPFVTEPVVVVKSIQSVERFESFTPCIIHTLAPILNCTRAAAAT